MLKYFNSKAKLIMVLGFSILLLQLATLAVEPLAMGLEAAPYVYVDPTSIPLNGVVNIHITTYDPTPDVPEVPDDFLYILVHMVVVRYPAGAYTEEYMLGTASAPGIDVQKIRIDYGEDVAIPFGPGIGAITIDGNNYYWWRTKKAGGPVYPNERIDLVPSPSPTGWAGEYEADVEGIAYYGTTPPESIRLRAPFNIPIHFEVPELALPISLTMALGFALVSAKSRRRELAKQAL